MPAVQVEESEYAAQRNVIGAVDKILANPKARKLMLEAQKIVNPNAPIPEIDAAAPLKEELDRVRGEVGKVTEMLARDKAEREEAVARERLATKWEAGRRYAQQDQRYNEEGLNKLEQFMEANAIFDHKIAIPAFERQNPLPEPVHPSNGRTIFDIFDQQAGDDTYAKELLATRGEDDAVVMREVHKTLNEMRGQARR